MKRYTPKELAKELKIRNKQEMRNMLRDYKRLLDPQPSNHGFFRVQNGKDIDCGPYMTYDEDDLITLRQICMFKQLGVKRSKIIRLIEEEEEGEVIDKLILMLEKKEIELREQVIMARQMRAWGMESVFSQIMLEGRTAHEFVEHIKDDFCDYDSGMINMCLSALTSDIEDIKRELHNADCLDCPAVKDYLDGNELSVKIQEMGRFDAKIIRKMRRLLRVLLNNGDTTEKMDLIDKHIKSLVKDIDEGYGFIGKVSFGLLWHLVCLAHDEEDFYLVDLSVSEYLSSVSQDEMYGDMRIMFDQAEWESELFEMVMDSLVKEEDDLTISQELLCRLRDYVCLSTEAERIFLIHLLKRIWNSLLREYKDDAAFEDNLGELEKLTKRFSDSIIPRLSDLMQVSMKTK